MRRHGNQTFWRSLSLKCKWIFESRKRADWKYVKKTYWKWQVVLWLLHQSSLCSKRWVSAVKLEAIGRAEKKRRRYCILIIWHTLQRHAYNDGKDRYINPYISVYACEGGRESYQLMAYSRWNKLGPLQLGMEDDTVNLIWVQSILGDI